MCLLFILPFEKNFPPFLLTLAGWLGVSEFELYFKNIDLDDKVGQRSNFCFGDKPIELPH